MLVWKVSIGVDESSSDVAQKYLYITKANNSLNPPAVKAGVSGLQKANDENWSEPIKKKLQRYSTPIRDSWQLAGQIALSPKLCSSYKSLRDLEEEFFKCIGDNKRLKDRITGNDKELFIHVDGNAAMEAMKKFVAAHKGLAQIVFPQANAKPMKGKGIKKDKDISEAMQVTPYASSLAFSKLPLFAKKVLQMDGSFNGYDVVYDDEQQCKYLEARAKKFGVVLNNGSHLDASASTESCAGKVGACLKYLRYYNEADDGWMAAQSMALDDPSMVSNTDFIEFCLWMNKWLPDWIDGMKLNSNGLAKKMATASA